MALKIEGEGASFLYLLQKSLDIQTSFGNNFTFWRKAVNVRVRESKETTRRNQDGNLQKEKGRFQRGSRANGQVWNEVIRMVNTR